MKICNSNERLTVLYRQSDINLPIREQVKIAFENRNPDLKLFLPFINGGHHRAEFDEI